jgi:hypothetical protein
MEPEGSFPHAQEPSTGPYPEPDQFSPHHPILSFIFHSSTSLLILGFTIPKVAAELVYRAQITNLSPLWSSGQSSWLQIHRSGFDSRRYQIFWEVVGPERGPLSLVSTIEELLERKSSGSSLEIREYGRGNPLRWPNDTHSPQKLALTSPTNGGRSVGIVRSRTKATEFVLFCNSTELRVNT